MSEWVNQIMIYKNDGYISLKEKARGGLLQRTQYSPPTRNRASSVKNTKSSRNYTLLLNTKSSRNYTVLLNKEVETKTWDWFVLLQILNILFGKRNFRDCYVKDSIYILTSMAGLDWGRRFLPGGLRSHWLLYLFLFSNARSLPYSPCQINGNQYKKSIGYTIYLYNI